MKILQKSKKKKKQIIHIQIGIYITVNMKKNAIVVHVLADAVVNAIVMEPVKDAVVAVDINVLIYPVVEIIYALLNALVIVSGNL